MHARAAVFFGPGRPFELREYPVPDPAPGAVLLKIRLSNVCGSDLHQTRGDGGNPIPPGGRVLGHEMVGEIVKLGEGVSTDSLGQPIQEGDRLVYTYFYPCRRCWHCTQGNFSLCTTRLAHYKESADDWPHFSGGFADYYYLRPGHFAFKVPDDLSDEMVSSANCALSQVIYSLQRGQFKYGDTIVIQGAGGLGLYAVAVAREMGAEKVIAVDGIPQRLELARQYGADEVVCLEEFTTPESRVQRVLDLTEGRGAEMVLEVVGMPQVIPEGLQMVQPGGAYVDVGVVSGKFSIEFFPAALLRRNARYVAVNHYEPFALYQALRFLSRNQKRLPLDRIISHTFPLERINEAFDQSEWFKKEAGKAGVTRAAIAPGL